MLLPVDCPNANDWNANCSCQNKISGTIVLHSFIQLLSLVATGLSKKGGGNLPHPPFASLQNSSFIFVRKDVEYTSIGEPEVINAQFILHTF